MSIVIICIKVHYKELKLVIDQRIVNYKLMNFNKKIFHFDLKAIVHMNWCQLDTITLVQIGNIVHDTHFMQLEFHCSCTISNILIDSVK